SQWTIDSTIPEVSLDEIGFPLRNMAADSITEYLSPQAAEYQFDSDELFRIGVSLTKDKNYLDEALVVFTRWCTKEQNLAPLFEKSIITWTEKEWQQYLGGLALFVQLARANNLPARLVEGYYCLSIINLTCYQWCWIEIFNGKNWIPWHIETPQIPFGGAEFVKRKITTLDELKNLKSGKIGQVRLKSFQFKTQQELIK
ncbi:transglutaminase-like domain-containing protein, partial [candidate division KSB1 bacterium]|nr:transglutaminase-like domain-containing protein [candidate division KSB1 bacterium]